MTSCVSDGVILLASGRWSSPANLMAWPTADKGTFLLARLTNWNGLHRGKGGDLGVGQSCDMRPVAGLLLHWACQAWQWDSLAAATVLSWPHSALRLEMPAQLAKGVRRLTITRIADTTHLHYSRWGRRFPGLENTVRPTGCPCVLNNHVWGLEMWQVL